MRWVVMVVEVSVVVAVVALLAITPTESASGVAAVVWLGAVMA
jgi:hypothetical protein